MRSAQAILVVIVILIAGCVTQKTSIPPPAGEVIFTIGREDKSDREFRSFGFKEITEYQCRAGIDCSTEAFPAYLAGAGRTGMESESVERITISFELNQSYNDVILRLARGGSETTVVRVNGDKTYLVTNKMLGSGEGYRVGVYNLKLGSLKKGRHTIEMSVADDGKGNAAYQWDAISLYAM
jgi:hypothetical protein